MRSRQTHNNQHRAALLACAGFVLAGGAFGASAGRLAAKAAQINSGDVKISAYPYPAQGNQGNEPHVPCQFYLLGFNMAASAGTATVDGWPPTGDGSQALTFAYTTRPDGSFVVGPYGLPAGHYKISVTDNKGDSILKHKVFWIDGPCAPSVSTPTSPGGPTDSTPIPPANPPTMTPTPPADTPTVTTTDNTPTSTPVPIVQSV